jgi:hypothetical protein
LETPTDYSRPHLNQVKGDFHLLTKATMLGVINKGILFPIRNLYILTIMTTINEPIGGI